MKRLKPKVNGFLISETMWIQVEVLSGAEKPLEMQVFAVRTVQGAELDV